MQQRARESAKVRAIKWLEPKAPTGESAVELKVTAKTYGEW